MTQLAKTRESGNDTQAPAPVPSGKPDSEDGRAGLCFAALPPEGSPRSSRKAARRQARNRTEFLPANVPLCASSSKRKEGKAPTESLSVPS